MQTDTFVKVPDGADIPREHPPNRWMQRKWSRDTEWWLPVGVGGPLLSITTKGVRVRDLDLPWSEIRQIRVEETRDGDVLFLDTPTSATHQVCRVRGQRALLLWMAGYLADVKRRVSAPDDTVDAALLSLRTGRGVRETRGHLRIKSPVVWDAHKVVSRRTGVEGEALAWKNPIGTSGWLLIVGLGCIRGTSGVYASVIAPQIGLAAAITVGIIFSVLATILTVLYVEERRLTRISWNTHQFVLPDGSRVPWALVHRCEGREEDRAGTRWYVLDVFVGEVERPVRLAESPVGVL